MSIMGNVLYILLDFIIYLLIASCATIYYYSYRKKALVGGIWGGLLIGTIGAVLATLVSTIYDWFTRLVIWLMIPKINGEFYFRVNIIAATIGAFIFVAILNIINHNRDRT